MGVVTCGGRRQDVVGLLVFVYFAAQADLRQPGDVIVGATQHAHHILPFYLLLPELESSNGQCSRRLHYD